MKQIILHQSDINEYLICPERFRAQFFGEVPNGPTDATAIGTGVHSAFEYVILGGTADEGWEKGCESFFEETRHPHYRWVQVKTEETARKHMATAFENLLRVTLPHLGTPMLVEQHFLFLFTTFPDIGVEIWLEGTIDFGDEGGMHDWKTRKADSTKYKSGWGGEGWKLRRFGVQPTVYTLAGHHLGFWQGLGWVDNVVDFTFHAASKTTNEVDVLLVQREAKDYQWLAAQTRNIAVMLESDLREWPKNDQHALCSSDWCANWHNCKGSNSVTELAVAVPVHLG